MVSLVYSKHTIIKLVSKTEKMPDNSILPSRKSDHIKINIENDVQSGSLSGFELYRFRHNALPEINLAEIDTQVSIFHKALSSPLLISSMTGGTAEAAMINQRLAEAAQKHQLAMGLGSQRAAIEKPELVSTFKVRKYAPDILLFANLGAVQLNSGYSVDQCMKAVEMIEADALFLHLNSLQEALQPEGDTNFGGLLQKIEIVCKKLPVPVIIKEVGWGITGDVARRLSNVGVQGIDVAGAGGTSWSQVESFRITDEIHRKIALDFRDWGVSTAECIAQVKREAPGMSDFCFRWY